MASGTQRLTADGALSPSGSPVRIWSIIVKSGGSPASVLVKNGTSTAGTAYDQITGTADQAVVINYEAGLVLPDGGYIDVDTNTSYVVVNYETVLR